MKRSLLLTAIITFVFVSVCSALETRTHQALNEYIAKNTLNGFSLNVYLQGQLGVGQGVQEV